MSWNASTGGGAGLGVIVAAFVVAGASATVACSARTSGSLAPERATHTIAPAGTLEMETEWFRLSYPTGWDAIDLAGLELGEGTMAAQVSNFDVEAPVCVGVGGRTLSDRQVLLRLTIGSELPWEGNIVRPAFEPTLDAPAEPGPFVDDCGVTDRRFGMFFGPDGHLMTAHALIGDNASSADIDALMSILLSLAPTGHPPVDAPKVEILFAEGTDPSIGRWAMGLRHEPQGATTLSFRTDEVGWGLYLHHPSPAVRTSLGAVGPRGLLVMGVAPPEASSVTVEVDQGLTLSGSIIPLPDGEHDGRVAFWVEPFEGVLTVEGQRLTPDAVLVIRDSDGEQLARRVLP